ncbi:glycosyltransferase [Rubellicoccus peritrichatus]|uniref:Glycosyltransferase n=1 Tax=Rubellicoccus peritrichatus TaxID=3080537 RepID=A0AAQ3QVT2_9BACT|nr:glycosyltransferase [Puniceicoccus sp. CR14]WOO41958.1 glycosyltransferase [Puniceicoccus sp. CR14]
MILVLSALALLAWLYLALFRGRFWEDATLPQLDEPDEWPSVIAIVPARNEAETIGETVRGILEQDYQGELKLVVIDDQSDDDTAQLAKEAADALNQQENLIVLSGKPLPEGWSGKVWAMQQGWEHTKAQAEPVSYVWFTDADILHQDKALRRLVAVATNENRGLVSTMVELRCKGFWEKALVPAFVYFFKLLYPFLWVSNDKKKIAGAAGGCMLVSGQALEKIDGPRAIQADLIDDCALGSAIKQSGFSIRLDLTRDSHSLRGYPKLADAWNTVARTAYTQLGYSPLKLIGSVVGLAWLFFIPVASFLSPDLLTALLGGITWLIMSLTFLPMVKFYRVNPFWLFALPFITIIYLGATIDSALRYHKGQGGQWKGRSQA